MTIDLRRYIAHAEAIVANHAIAPGIYRRWNTQAEDGSRDLGINPYGCADAANILYTIGRFPREPEVRACWVEALQGLQSPESGLFEEPTHHPIHTTAHCIAALELFDAGPSHPLTALRRYTTAEGMRDFVASLDWRGNPWRESHRGAGLYAALVLAEEVDLAWQDAYFAWLWDNTDPATGLLAGRDLPRISHSGTTTMVPHMAGTFHYLFNMQYARRPMRYAERLIDSCLEMEAERQFPLGERIGFAEIDWFYCMNRALRACDHRFGEARSAMERLARRLGEYVVSLDPGTDDGLNDLHALFGNLCAFAEVQQALPGLVITDRPLKLVLDRRPFI
ncbi:hypothetical protein [Chelatococcus asaccharovorans]|uniref:Prenyltransferase/squalene oxidase-like repeat protein n=1 Tax=Chelatococcus asaccharovorans TaxID=28210 RepID=A0A2V3TY88_9HYPH|nr:hypothetical protein [Chelatococcus asaccharovorans]MBS7706823.1 hypothetical protein [Chelatococcus asaccharovorans]PXW54031.1 hypothetical protein C7450_11260 [Chelatococcus asaccharovorans]